MPRTGPEPGPTSPLPQRTRANGRSGATGTVALSAPVTFSAMPAPKVPLKPKPSSGRELMPGEAMLWQRGADTGKPIWIAVTPNGERVKTTTGHYITRYDREPGAAYYNPSRAKLDPEAKPEPLPPGFEADSPEGIVARFCFGDEAKKDWAFLDAWKRRRNTAITHAGCGDGQWPEVPQRLPLTCPRCGVLRGDATLYAQWYTVKDPEGEGVRACVFEAWLSGKRRDYEAGKRPTPITSWGKVPPPKREPITEEGVDAIGTASPSGASPALLMVGVLLTLALLAGLAYAVM